MFKIWFYYLKRIPQIFSTTNRIPHISEFQLDLNDKDFNRHTQETLRGQRWWCWWRCWWRWRCWRWRSPPPPPSPSFSTTSWPWRTSPWTPSWSSHLKSRRGWDWCRRSSFLERIILIYFSSTKIHFLDIGEASLSLISCLKINGSSWIDYQEDFFKWLSRFMMGVLSRVTIFTRTLSKWCKNILTEQVTESEHREELVVILQSQFPETSKRAKSFSGGNSFSCLISLSKRLKTVRGSQQTRKIVTMQISNQQVLQ